MARLRKHQPPQRQRRLQPSDQNPTPAQTHAYRPPKTEISRRLTQVTAERQSSPEAAEAKVEARAEATSRGAAETVSSRDRADRADRVATVAAVAADATVAGAIAAETINRPALVVVVADSQSQPGHPR